MEKKCSQSKVKTSSPLMNGSLKHSGKKLQKSISLIICVDFDGTCVTNEFPNIGKEIGATPVLKKLVENGHHIILYTMRSDIQEPPFKFVKDSEWDQPSFDFNGKKYDLPNDFVNKEGKYLSDAVNWFKEHEIPLFGINENPEQKQWTSSPKPFAHIYIDDSAIGCPIISLDDISSKPFVSWYDIEIELKKRKLIS